MRVRRLLFAVAWFVLAAVMAGSANGQTLARKGWVGSGITVESWWQSGIFYQIDPFSFQDSNGDGFGDLNGITERLDYLERLGVDAVILSPFQLEPRAAAGAQSTSQPFDPRYGSEDDLAALVAESSRRKIRLLVDLPVNISMTDEETAGAARFWLSRGIAGLRLINPDRISSPLTAAQLRERVLDLRRICAGYPGDRVLLWDMPESGTSLPELTHRKRAGAHPVQRSTQAAQLSSQAQSSGPGTQLVVNHAFAKMPALTAAELRRLLSEQKPSTATSAEMRVTDSSDLPRSFDRYGNRKDDVELARVLAAALLLGAGAPELYYGQEIGMETTPERKGEAAGAGNPTPMQWGGDHTFTTGDAWIATGRGAEVWNVAMEDQDRESLLNWYRRLTALRHQTSALRTGTMEVLASVNPDVVAWLRRPQHSSTTPPVLILANLSARSLTVSLTAELASARVIVAGGVMKTLASTSVNSDAEANAPIAVGSISLPAYGVVVGELRQPGLETMPAPVRKRR